MLEKKFNPFFEYGITNYEQYKNFPFLESISISQLKNKINSQIRSNFKFPERLLILGEPGAGKTTSLFYIHDLLEESKKCNVIIFSKFFTDAESFEAASGESLRKLTNSNIPVYILVDFPDTVTSSNMKKFLDFLWSVITSKCDNISLIFALNISHYNKSFSFSEILGKFNKFRIERMNCEETKELITKRLKMIEAEGFFDEKVCELIFKYSKGIPRNIICTSMNLFDQFLDEDKITEEKALGILKDSYSHQIINDRVEDNTERELYKRIIEIVQNDFGGKSNSQKELVTAIKDKLGIGRNRAVGFISKLNKFGVIAISKGGENNTKKIISLS